MHIHVVMMVVMTAVSRAVLMMHGIIMPFAARGGKDRYQGKNCKDILFHLSFFIAVIKSCHTDYCGVQFFTLQK